MTVEEWLGSEDPDAEPQLREVSRGCTEQSRFTCSTAGDVRTCTATCQGDLCNTFQDVAARVQQYEREEKTRREEEAARREEEAARKKEEDARKKEEDAQQTPQWVIPVAVVVPLVVGTVAFVVYRMRANRRKTIGEQLSR